MWTQGLNPEQVQAVLHQEGPLLILAGAGSGKTTVLVSRTGRLIAEKVARPDEICVLTFTNKAARELKSRVSHKLGDSAKGIWAGTFHSFGLQLLKKYSAKAGLPAQFGVVDSSDCQSILKELMRDVAISGKDKFDTDKLLNLINYLRTHGKAKLEAQDEYHELAEVLYPKFVKRLDLMGVVDFEGLLIKPYELLKNHPEVLEKVQDQYRFIMVDEFQDTNDLQMKLIDLMAKKYHNLAVVGDDDQSIYGWRGAQVSNILQFPKRYAPCQVVKLERNYRSTGKIIELANDVIAKNKNRHGKVLRPSTELGELPELFVMQTEEEEAEFVCREIKAFINKGYKYQDIAVLYRSNSQAAFLESNLRTNSIPYTVSGGTALFDRKEVKDVLGYIRAAMAPHDVAVKRILNTPARGIGDTSLEKLVQYGLTNKVSFIKACYHWKEAGVNDKAGEAISRFLDLLKSFPQRLLDSSEGRSVGGNLEKIFRDMGYRDYLFHTSSDATAGDKKWILVEVVGRILDSFIAKAGRSEKILKEFLDSMELRDREDEEESNEVSLMTLHACKGLEFPVVLLIGVEEDLIPHRTLGTDVDEERRLFYVGLTRAEEHLILTRCRTRKRHGQIKPVSPSRFLLEITDAHLKKHERDARPVNGEEKKSLLESFFAKAESKALNVKKY
ncbi:MAG: UvrD-helicase domain-containing protein [Proteobacteria bacterium]|jgi:DNA helicase-2/ATP-dependent DNA helicase PcrA|nr:UvrD-helicase domain-containing protein [Pseudomonadota bacterium]